MPFGRLRLLALRQSWQLGIGAGKPVNPARFIESNTWQLKESEMLDFVAQQVALSVDELRLAFHSVHLVGTQLYLDIRNWEQTSVHYRILPTYS